MVRTGNPRCRRHAIAPPAKTQFAGDSALEGDGIELPVPREIGSVSTVGRSEPGIRSAEARGGSRVHRFTRLATRLCYPRGRVVAIDLEPGDA